MSFSTGYVGQLHDAIVMLMLSNNIDYAPSILNTDSFSAQCQNAILSSDSALRTAITRLTFKLGFHL